MEIPRLPVFVYGTLRAGQPHHRLIADWLTGLSPAVLDDHALYGAHHPFPYAAPAAGRQVVGELVSVRADCYRRLLARLDDLEGYRPGRSENHYRRVVRPVRCAGDDRLSGHTDAWVYVAGETATIRLDDSQLIPSGDWLDKSG